MTQSTKPYLIRALYEWCMDQGFTPYIAVVADERTLVPRQFVRDGQIVLNLGPDATHQLVIGNDLITCSARFGGVAQSLSIPVDCVAAIYARENGQGMAFEVGATVPAETRADEPKVADLKPAPSDEPPPPGGTPSPAGGGPSARPHLTRVK